jgi:hypothetical protein
MKCTGQELFNALTQREMIQIFTGTCQQFLKFSVVKYMNSNIFVEWVPGRGVGRHSYSYILIRIRLSILMAILIWIPPQVIHKLENQRKFVLLLFTTFPGSLFIFLTRVIGVIVSFGLAGSGSRSTTLTSGDVDHGSCFVSPFSSVNHVTLLLTFEVAYSICLVCLCTCVPVLFIPKKIEFPIPGHGYLLRGTGI